MSGARIYLTSGFMEEFIPLTVMIPNFILLMLEDHRWWYAFAANLPLTAYNWLAYFAFQARLKRRLTRALREDVWMTVTGRSA